MKAIVALPLATLLFAVAVSGQEVVRVPLLGSNGAGISLSSGSDKPSSLSVSSKDGEFENGQSVSYGGFGSPSVNEEHEQSGSNVNVQNGGEHQISNGSGRRRHQHGQREHNHEHRSRGSRHESRGNSASSNHESRRGSRHESRGESNQESHHGSRHESRGESNQESHHGSRHESRGESNQESRHGSRRGGSQGSLSGRLGGLGNVAENLAGHAPGSLNLGGIAKIPTGGASLNLGNLRETVQSVAASSGSVGVTV